MKVYAYQCNTKNKFPFDIVARLIKYFSKTNYSHYVLGVRSDCGNLITVGHSHGAGVESLTGNEFLKKYSIYKRFAICDMNRHVFKSFMAIHEDKKYGYAQNIGLLLKIWGIVKNNPFGKGAKRIICNELIILFLNEVGICNIEDTDELNLKDTEEILLRV